MAGISPAAEAGRTSDRPLTCGSGWSLAVGIRFVPDLRGLRESGIGST